MKELNERLKKLPCQIGLNSKCCKHCLLGPCIITNEKDVGACGANQDVISSRNLLRVVASGAACHTGHALHLLDFLGKKFPYNYIEKKAPKYLLNLWEKLGIMPKIEYEHFKEISEAFHASTMGVNADYKDILLRAIKLGIIDGYYGLYLATELEDKEYGKPKIRKGEIDLGVIRKDKINIAVHGHELVFAEAIAKEAGKNKNINLIGVCCTGASLLSRHGIPLASNVVFQEDVLMTGMIDAFVLDSQCVFPSLADLAECFNTTLITTNPIAKIASVMHMPITNKKNAEETAKKIIGIAIKNFEKRKKNKYFAENLKKADAVVGFDEEIANSLFKQLKNKEIKGIIAVIGCKNPRVKEDWFPVYKKLSKNHAILTTGCMAFELGKQGLLDGKRFFHLGSCVNNARIAEIFKKIAEKSEKRITDMNFLVSAPMPMTEKCISIGFFFASLGIDVHFGYPFMIKSDSKMENFLKTTLKEHFHSRIFLEMNPEKLEEEVGK